ncbi:MAG: hypothetical protein R3F54_14870 [Alphaproteobacteria bacterium]
MRPFITSLIISLGATAITAATATWLIREELAARPPIAIIDYGPIGNAVSLGVPPESIQPYFAEIKRRAQAYEAAGYIVINAASVDAAPDEMFVPPLDNVPEAWRTPSVDPKDTAIPRLSTDGEGEP